MSKIEWTDETWNPAVGCSKVSAGCKHCYAIRDARRLAGNPNPKIREVYQDLVTLNGTPNWTGKVKLIEDRLEQPLHWRKPRRIFVNSMSDLFHEELPDGAIDRVFAVMALCPQHTFQVLTKRAERMCEYMAAARKRIREMHQMDMTVARMAPVEKVEAVKRIRRLSFEQSIQPLEWPLPNVHLGVSVEERKNKDRLFWLRRTPAAVRFVSLEPLLEDLWALDLNGIDQCIVGGESGPKARPMHPDWARSVRDQCQAAGVAFFFKQWGRCKHINDGGWMEPAGKKFAGRLLDGREWNEQPADLRVREDI